MYFKTTTLTKESRLTTIGPRYVSTSTTFLTRVASIYKGNTFPTCFSFVGKEALKLLEWPVANPLIHLLPSLLFADTRKVFKYKGCDIRLHGDLLRHSMVHVLAEPLLLPRHDFKPSFSRSSAFCLKRAPVVKIPAASSTNLCIREEFPIGGSC